ncbi:hypothetical protein AB0F91_45195 [Amycolatopsis sp. NPDC023774]|uniref:hypothetical protein n=1 Tax=Amycolatopsis sp. NPDC023774 TaxID=3155015 RepID=UPI0033C01B64
MPEVAVKTSRKAIAAVWGAVVLIAIALSLIHAAVSSRSSETPTSSAPPSALDALGCPVETKGASAAALSTCNEKELATRVCGVDVGSEEPQTKIQTGVAGFWYPRAGVYVAAMGSMNAAGTPGQNENGTFISQVSVSCPAGPGTVINQAEWAQILNANGSVPPRLQNEWHTIAQMRSLASLPPQRTVTVAAKAPTSEPVSPSESTPSDPCSATADRLLRAVLDGTMTLDEAKTQLPAQIAPSKLDKVVSAVRSSKAQGLDNTGEAEYDLTYPCTH